MRLDKDYLIELELDSFFAMRANAIETLAPAVMPAPAKTSPAITARPTLPNASAARPTPPTTPTPPTATRPMVAKAAPISSPEPIVIDLARAAKIAALSPTDLIKDATACQACGLCRERKQAVVGLGEANAPWLIIGDAPGNEEDDMGEPFVGPAGKLLDAMVKALGLTLGRDVYLTNVVKCRPPGNRPPQHLEVSACSPYLDRQIDLLQPKMILALGKTAITRLIGSDDTLNDLRGQVHTYRGIPVIATFHPSYLLLRLPEKLKAWEDLTFARREFNKRISKSATL